MKSNQRVSTEKDFSEVKKTYFHPLSLQSLPPNRFTVMVNRILQGRMSLLIQRGRDNDKTL